MTTMIDRMTVKVGVPKEASESLSRLAGAAADVDDGPHRLPAAGDLELRVGSSMARRPRVPRHLQRHPILPPEAAGEQPERLRRRRDPPRRAHHPVLDDRDLAKVAMHVQPDRPHLNLLASITDGRTGGQTTQTDTCLRHNRASRRGGHRECSDSKPIVHKRPAQPAFSQKAPVPVARPYGRARTATLRATFHANSSGQPKGTSIPTRSPEVTRSTSASSDKPSSGTETDASPPDHSIWQAAVSLSCAARSMPTVITAAAYRRRPRPPLGLDSQGNGAAPVQYSRASRAAARRAKAGV